MTKQPDPLPTGIWTPDGPVSPDVVTYTRPILERATLDRRPTCTVSGVVWTFAALHVTDTPPPDLDVKRLARAILAAQWYSPDDEADALIAAQTLAAKYAESKP